MNRADEAGDPLIICKVPYGFQERARSPFGIGKVQFNFDALALF